MLTNAYGRIIKTDSVQLVAVLLYNFKLNLEAEDPHFRESCTVGKFEFDFFLMSHPHAAHSRVQIFAFCQSSAPGRLAVTWVPSGVGSFPINWWPVISGRPILAISFERRLVLQ